MQKHHDPQNHGKKLSAIATLPKQFVTSMKTLFEIMDDKKTGFVKLTDIERRWQDNGSKGLPQDVIECLRTTTPSNGFLSFDQFCAGLKISLLRNPSSDTGGGNGKSLPSTIDTQHPKSSSSSSRLQPLNTQSLTQWNTNNTAAVCPNNALLPSSQQRSYCLNNVPPRISANNLSITTAPPPKPPRTCFTTNNNRKPLNTTATPANHNHVDRLDKAEIRNALQNWQMGVLMNEMELKSVNLAKPIKPLPHATINLSSKNSDSSIGDHHHQCRESADGSTNGGGGASASTGTPSSISATPTAVVAASGSAVPLLSSQIAMLHHQKKSYMKRREPRRHTLQNGFDYNMLKKLKYLEMEKELLLQGLNAVEVAQRWYFKQIAIVQDKIKYISHVGSLDIENFTESYMERLNFQSARVNEINRNLYELAETWNYGEYPLHINLAMHNPSATTTTTPTSATRQHLSGTSAITGSTVVNYNVDVV